MKKILVAFTAIHFPAHVRSFAINVARDNDVPLLGQLLPDGDSIMDYPFPNDLQETQEDISAEGFAQEEKQLQRSVIDVWKDECNVEGVSATIQEQGDLEALLEAAADADLLITEADISFKSFSLDDLLSKVKCPVVLVDYNAVQVDKIVLTFDGSQSSIYAIQKYAELFPKWQNKAAYLLTINPDEADKQEHNEFFKQWLPGRFPQLQVVERSGDVKKELLQFLQQLGANTLVVMGAYGRSSFSRFFRASTADTVLEETRLSLFLAHE